MDFKKIMVLVALKALTGISKTLQETHSLIALLAHKIAGKD